MKLLCYLGLVIVEHERSLRDIGTVGRARFDLALQLSHVTKSRANSQRSVNEDCFRWNPLSKPPDFSGSHGAYACCGFCHTVDDFQGFPLQGFPLHVPRLEGVFVPSCLVASSAARGVSYVCSIQ